MKPYESFLIIDISSYQLTEQERNILTHPTVAGVILFSRNFKNSEQLIDLTSEIKTINDQIFICVDQEGGRVQRFKDPLTRLPALRQLGKYFQNDLQGALELTENIAWLMASELIAHNIDLSLAPVVDLNLELNEVIANRSFGQDINMVSNLTNAWLRGIKDTGMPTFIKHFPGHGSVREDSHTDLPIDNRGLSDILARDGQPFINIINENVDIIMPAHIQFSQIDNKPTTISSIWLKDILRKKLKFKGTIMSDCLTMKAISLNLSPIEKISQALQAGCELLILCNQKEVLEMQKYIDKNKLPHKKRDRHSLNFQTKRNLNYKELLSSQRYLFCRDRIDHLNLHYPIQ